MLSFFQQGSKHGNQKQVQQEYDDAALHFGSTAGQENGAGKFRPAQLGIILCQRDTAQKNVTDADPVQAVLAALPEGAARNICRIVLTGETDRAPNPAALHAALEGQVFAMQLRDETRARRDLWARAGEGTLRGQFLAQLKQKYDAADSDRDRETIVMAARWGLAALDHDEEVVTL